jgi:ABC-type nitrate/sulfonate/bicarbonate transport system permease component
MSRPRKGRGFRATVAAALPVAVVLLVLLVWEAGVRLFDVRAYILPAPSQIAARLATDAPALAYDGAITLAAALLGFGLACTVSIAAAALMAQSRVLERSLLPLALLVKVTPVVAVAPLLVIWLGFGIAPRAIVAALIAFYPMLVNALAGFRAVSPESADLFASLAASRWETLRLLQWPSALPYVFAGARVAVPLALIGAVVGEWAGAERGLGRAVLLAYTNLDLPLLFAAVVVLAVSGTALTAALTFVERRVLAWTGPDTM